MKVNGVSFPEAATWLAEQAGIATSPSRKTPIRPMPLAPVKAALATEKKHAEQPSGLPVADALKLAEGAAERIWTPEGAGALAYLRGRGLNEKAIQQFGLGWDPEVVLPTRDGDRYWQLQVS